MLSLLAFYRLLNYGDHSRMESKKLV
jgi:hypothetical protein